MIVRQSIGYYKDNHLVGKQLKKLTTTTKKRKTTFNLKRGENEGMSKTTSSMKKKNKRKSTRLSEEGVENN